MTGEDKDQHYFSEEPTSEATPTTVELRLPDLRSELRASTGVFAANEIDRGTHFLLQTAPPPPRVDGDLLDLGCGYGPIAVTLGVRFPDRRVWAVDINRRALRLTEENASALGLPNVVTRHANDDLPADVTLAAIYSNPPVRVGKAQLHDMLLRWMRRLAVGGTAFLVVHKHLGADSLARWFERRSFEVERLGSKGGYRVLAVTRSGPIH